MKITLASIYSILSFLVLGSALGQTPYEIKKIAILDPIDSQGKVSCYVKKSLQNAFTKAVLASNNLEAYDRNDIPVIQKENEFQRQGWVKPEEICKMGKVSGVSYVLASEVLMPTSSEYYIMARIIEVETSKVVKVADVMTKEDEIPKRFHDLAEQLLDGFAETSSELIYKSYHFMYLVPLDK